MRQMDVRIFLLSEKRADGVSRPAFGWPVCPAVSLTVPRLKLAAIADLPESGSRAVEVDGRAILVCRTSAGIFAIENMCSHAFSRLDEGKVKGPHIFCPLHGIRFDLRTGAPNGNLTRKHLTTYPVIIEDGHVFAELP